MMLAFGRALAADVPPKAAARRVVVTGIGMVNPLGNDAETAWRNILDGRSAIGPITRFDAAGLPVSLAAEVNGFDAGTRIPRRLVVKSDRFAHYAIAASGEALTDSGIDLAAEDPFRIGISFGNNSGGWDICERGFGEYYLQGPQLVNPWQATAWFPTAPQGFVSIRFGLRGFSKSFACDRASGGCALFFGVRCIQWGRADVVLAGGTEAPITRFVIAALASTGEISTLADPGSAFCPFAEGRSGLVLGEGSAVLVLEEFGRARHRGAQIYGEILAVEQRTGRACRPDALTAAVTAALGRAAVRPSELDVVFAEGCGTPDGDMVEAAALVRALGGGRYCAPVTAPKSAFGHLYGASLPSDLACALLAGRDTVVPGTAGTQRADASLPLDVVTSPRARPVRTALVVSRAREGSAVALVTRCGAVEDERCCLS